MKPSFHKYHSVPDTKQIVPHPRPGMLTLYKPLLTVQVWSSNTGRQRPVLVIILISIVHVYEVPVVDAGLGAVQAEVEVQPVLGNPDRLQLRVAVQSLVDPEIQGIRKRKRKRKVLK